MHNSLHILHTQSAFVTYLNILDYIVTYLQSLYFVLVINALSLVYFVVLVDWQFLLKTRRSSVVADRPRDASCH